MDGSSLKLQRFRRFFKPFVSRYIPLSRDLEGYLREKIGVPPAAMTQIYNGVDSEKFCPPVNGREALPIADFAKPDCCVVGTVGRMQTVKDQLTLVRAFLQVLKTVPDARKYLRLVLVGDGPLRATAEKLLAEEGALQLAWLAGARHDIPGLLRGLDVFVLPSLAEGISNTILEAMATGLPVVATRVGGNPELVEDGVTGTLVPAADPAAMAAAIADYLLDAGKRQRHGMAAREMVERKYSMDAMVAAYMGVYDRVLASH
jgi:sugar transferase (PEP-CTERM/EpsH1 system associated)